jgi:hypothetical protein
MANQRAADQVFIGTWITVSLGKKINAARGGKGRSQWVREAIAKMLMDAGFDVSADEWSAPDRVGKIRKPKRPMRKRPMASTFVAAGGRPESAYKLHEPAKSEATTLRTALNKDTAGEFVDKLAWSVRRAKSQVPPRKG